ncbi:hypothetical protein [Terriglobus roseus]|uniref:Uncharacterized protein n=1 Tax=Terriglobus roseus TaxID=392734 RepID=A0A1H4JX53_9BACT|nr:hypothetical protein [Terriglobus roseus]SEB50727.1 hypothetical protein SAMN05443244_0867 [Terriglobus roseus]
MLAVNELDTTGEQSLETQERIAQALDHILRSPRFKDSQQLQSLLRYVVDESVKGNEDGLKERIIGIYVFGRRPDYDTTGDPIVRSRMGLLRKRLAQYYESDEGDEAPIQIVIPNGTYRPAFILRPLAKESRRETAPAETVFVPAAIPLEAMSAAPTFSAPAPVVAVADSTSVVLSYPKRNPLLKAAIAAVVFALVASGIWWSLVRPQRNLLEALWSPIISGKQPIYIYTGTMPVYEPGSPPDEASSPTDLYWPIRVPDAPPVDLPETGPERVYSYGEGMLTGSVYADVRVAAFLYKYNRTPVLRTGPNLPYMDLKGSPLILIGSFDNYWTRVMNESLPFYFDRGFGIRERDGTHRRWYNPLKAEMTPRMMDDYALIFRVMDSKAGAPVLAIAGLSTCGTHAAADFVTDPTQKNTLANISRADLKSKNIELVLHTSLVKCAPTSVEIIASKVW